MAVVYGLAVSLGYYRDIGWRDLPRLLLSAFQTSAVVMVVLGATGGACLVHHRRAGAGAAGRLG